MVTGRELPDLRRVFPEIGGFDAVVAENGALLWRPGPASRGRWPLPRRRHSSRRSGRAASSRWRSAQVIVATADENAPVMAETLQAVGLDWRLILNKDSVMCLPPGVDKASGLAAALAALDLRAEDVLGVGDAENDLTFLAVCGVSAAVANALPDVKAAADIVTPQDDGAGVTWLIERLLEDPDSFVELAGQSNNIPAQ